MPQPFADDKAGDDESMRKYFQILYLLPFFVGSSYGADSTVTITGYLKDNTCSVSVDSQRLTVDLMSHATKQLDNKGAATPAVSFKIDLDRCGTSVTAVKVGYTGTPDINNPTLLKIDTGNNAASGMGIQILDSNRRPISLNAVQESLNWMSLTPNQSNSLDFYAHLKATGSPITAGIVTATASITLEFQ